jgi:glyoxylate/hydroxypyruvate reductase A
MKPTAWLINIARGAVVDEPALLAALEKQRIAGAVLDVFDREPLPPSHRCGRWSNVVVTPHISGPSTPDEIAPVFNDNLARYLAGPPASLRGGPLAGVLTCRLDAARSRCPSRS